MNDYIKNVIIGLAIPLILQVADKSIPLEKIDEVMEKAGAAVSKELRKVAGAHGEPIETLAQKITDCAYTAWNRGLNKDDTIPVA